MKRLLFLFFLLASSAAAQGIRFSSTVTQQGTVGIAANVVTLPAAPVVKFCIHPANAVPCTNLATTYTDQTLSTPCSTSTQIVRDGTTTCVASPDSQNNWGVWVASNAIGYDYTVTLAGGVNLGPFYAGAPGNVSTGANNNFTGNNTHSGTETFTGPVTATSIDSTLYVTSAGSDACAAINTQISNLPLVAGFRSGIVDFTALASASQPVPCGTTVNAGSPYLWLRGPGAAALTFNCTVNGDCFNTQEGAGAVITPGFRTSGFSVRGTGTANGVAFHLGDMVGGRFDDLAADGFTGASGACMWFENKNFFFEANIVNNVFCGQTPGSQLGNTKDFRWSVTTASVNNASFQYNRYYGLKYSTLANQTAFSYEGGVHNGSIWQATGNTTSATGTTVIAMSGSTFPTSGVNTIVGGTFAFKSECTGCSGAAFYSIPSGYTLAIESGAISDNGGFTYTVAGTLSKALNPDPLAVPFLASYSATGVRANQYNLTINNPATNRNLSISDPGANAAFCISLGCSLTSPALVGTGPNTNVFSVQHQIGGNFYQFQATNPFTARTFTLNDNLFNMPFGWSLLETGAPSAALNQDACYGDSTLHVLKCSYNNGTFFQQTQTIVSGTATMTTAAIAAGAFGANVTPTITGGAVANVLATDTIIITPNAQQSVTNAPLKTQCWPAAGSITCAYFNPTAGAIVPVAETDNIRVTR
jgi:hypothetical protein